MSSKITLDHDVKWYTPAGYSRSISRGTTVVVEKRHRDGSVTVRGEGFVEGPGPRFVPAVLRVRIRGDYA